MNTFCEIITADYFPGALALYKSVAKYNSEIELQVLIADNKQVYFLSCWEGYDMHQSIDWMEKAVAFEIHELNTFTRITPFTANSKIIIHS